MTLKEKQELVLLLNKYMADLTEKNKRNIEKAKFADEKGIPKYRAGIEEGVKSRYKYARVIATKLSVEVGEEMKTIFDL